MADQPQVILSGFADEAANQKTAEQQFAAFSAVGLQYYTIRFIDAGKGVKNVMQLTKAMSLALAPHNIRVNAVGPGSIDTAMMASVNANPDALETAMSRTPLRRMGTAREIADVVAFLVSDKASYITGETVYVDGGRLGLNYTC